MIGADGRIAAIPTRKHRGVRLPAVAGLGLVLLVDSVVILATVAAASAGGFDPGSASFLLLGLWLYWTLGALIVSRVDGHVIGWLFVISAAMLASVFACFALGELVAAKDPASALNAWLNLLGTLLFTPAIILAFPAVMLVFPTGTLPGPRWRWPVGLLVVMVVARMFAILLRPGLVDDGDQMNPLTRVLPVVPSAVNDALSFAASFGRQSIPIAAALGVAAIVVQFRRGRGEQRQQMKWFLAAFIPAAILLPLSLSDVVLSFPIVNLLSIMTLPLGGIAIAIAVLRYRLYDIDRVISRTIAYGLITALLVATFLLVNLALQTVLSAFVNGNSLAIAGSTLLISGLFTPLRRRVQHLVDRRFDRARYDGERTTEAFSVRMRDAIDLPTLATDLDLTIRDAIAPAHVGLWLRDRRSKTVTGR